MHTRPTLLRRLTGWRRQIALAVLFALQAAISLSPLLETGEKGKMGAHAEQTAQHKYQHDETTCAVCAVRSLHSSPSESGAAFLSDRERTVTALDAPAIPSRLVDPTALPRAPPQLI